MFSIIHLSLTSAFSTLEEVKRIDTSGTCNFENLEYNTTYYWRVKSVDEYNGNESDWSSTCSFVTIPESIVIIINTSDSDYNNNILFEFETIEILPKICEAATAELHKNICNPALEIVGESRLNKSIGTCKFEQKVLTDC